MATLSPSGLKTVGAYNTSTWKTTYNDNLTLLNSTLLKLDGLLDVDDAALASGKIPAWSVSAGKWVFITPAARRKIY